MRASLSGDFEIDLQGWASQHHYLTEAMESERPGLVVEVGVWKGGSTITMAKKAQELNLDCVVLAVDTWLGAWEHWTGDFYSDLKFEAGYPTMFYTFSSNVRSLGLTDFVLPLPLDSVNASFVISTLNMPIDVLHVDGGHNYSAVMADLNCWWPMIRPGGLYIGDDYFMDGIMWGEVKQAHDEFFGQLSLPIENTGGKCRIRKPL
jgi:predicted O-methyltransferase YrrM